jgi:hypothetical protein
MNNTEVVAFSPEDVGHPQLLDNPLVSVPEHCFGPLDVNEASHVFSDVRRQIRTGPDAVAELRAGPVQAWPDEIPALFKVAEGTKDRDVVAMRKKGLQWLSIASDERSRCCGHSFAQSRQRLSRLSHHSILSDAPGREVATWALLGRATSR